MDLEEVIAFQHRHGFDDIHLVAFEVEQFHLAHTRLEHSLRKDVGFDLYSCPVHQWLSTFESPPAIGVFAVTAPDDPSPSFKAGPAWQLHPIEIEPLDQE